MITIIPAAELAAKPTAKPAATPSTWRTELSNAIRSSQELLRFVGLQHTDMLQKPAIVVPVANHDNNQHAADENLRIANLWYSVQLMTALLTMK